MLGGQIINATLAAPPRQHDGERAKIKAGRVPEAWRAKPAKLTRKEGDARWTIKVPRPSRPSPRADGRCIVLRRSAGSGVGVEGEHSERPLGRRSVSRQGRRSGPPHVTCKHTARYLKMSQLGSDLGCSLLRRREMNPRRFTEPGKSLGRPSNRTATIWNWRSRGRQRSWSQDQLCQESHLWTTLPIPRRSARLGWMVCRWTMRPACARGTKGFQIQEAPRRVEPALTAPSRLQEGRKARTGQCRCAGGEPS